MPIALNLLLLPPITVRPWEAIPGKQLAEETVEFKVSSGMLRFQDDNFGVAELRTREFGQTIVPLDGQRVLKLHDRDRPAQARWRCP